MPSKKDPAVEEPVPAPAAEDVTKKARAEAQAEADAAVAKADVRGRWESIDHGSDRPRKPRKGA